MSVLFDRLAHLFEMGHREDIPDLMTDSRFHDAERSADAAVLIAVTDRPDSQGGPGVILTQRPTGMRNHPGQVAFPGGKLDRGEDAIAAAVREAYEELAMEPSHVKIIGTTDRYQTGTGFDITPVLATVPADLPLVPNPGEVEAWFEAPLGLLFERSNWTEQEVLWEGATRRYFEMHYEGFRIWGVTAAIIANLSRRLAWQELVGE